MAFKSSDLFNSIRYRGSTPWNTLSKAYQALPNLELFKEKLKKDTTLLKNIDFHRESSVAFFQTRTLTFIISDSYDMRSFPLYNLIYSYLF